MPTAINYSLRIERQRGIAARANLSLATRFSRLSERVRWNDTKNAWLNIIDCIKWQTYKNLVSDIRAPFTNEEVRALNRWQSSKFVHPFTCGQRDLPGHKEHADKVGDHDHGILIATQSGWICPVCDYKQDWAHAFMAIAPPELPFAAVAKLSKHPSSTWTT